MNLVLYFKDLFESKPVYKKIVLLMFSFINAIHFFKRMWFFKK